MPTIRKVCRELPKGCGRYIIEVPGWGGLSKFVKMDKEDAIEWIQSNGRPGTVYVIDGDEYSNDNQGGGG